MIVVLLVVAYLLGSLSGSLLLGKWRGVDIRTLGSGNAGGTNALRTQGVWFALGTVLIDVGKGVLATWLAAHWLPASMWPWSGYACALAAVVGHVWPAFHGFRGGKGAGTLIGALCVVWPMALSVVLGVWLLSLMLSGYVGLSTVLAGFSLLVLALFAPEQPWRLVFAASVALLLLFTHRANMARLRAGTEPRFERVRVLGRLFVR
ncbi:glycerol-3-phosphate 1-O-acyltransferase PlsY [Rhodanobacter sp. AS-Z3]|uniref:glycerol-3-phosphate 1-O-acyltransferase PlsY n=1 Tax=Rhodanobacter sp. AS-Z3 TaxID=3031330 RepID=UPI00247AB054|nr:glycerol-3-phosphate 1-O-acyltransferase PlsY [Rhodanobacter sp. AS-Z3]WEN15072.1 glycerol-3-phosphate 1-O-acyltransferase PlsY [Rhodanobacter sp. AS-Z3]